MSRSPARPADRRTPAPKAGAAAARRNNEDGGGLMKIELELRDGRYLLAYSRDHA